MHLSVEASETMALQVLAWLANDQELLGVFTGATGAGADDLRSRAGDPVFLASVLDFLLMDDAWVMRFCDDEGVAYGDILPARAALPGGEQVHWT